MQIKKLKRTALLPFMLAFFITASCNGMKMAAEQDAQQSNHSAHALNESSGRELIQKKLLAKKYIDIVREVSKLSDEQKEFIKALLNESHSILTPNVLPQQVLSGHKRRIKAAAFSPNGHFALTGSTDCTARLWDLTQSPITSQELSGHTDWVIAVAFSQDSRFALTGSEDRTARIWDLTKSPITSQELIGHTREVSSVAFSPNGGFCLTGSYDSTARLWDLTTSAIRSQKIADYTCCVTLVAFSNDGRFALTISCHATRLFDFTKSPFTSQKLTGHTSKVVGIAFSPDGRFALTGSHDHTARLWDLTKSPITSQVLTGHADWINSVTFSSDGMFALTGSSDHTARLWNLAKLPITCQVLTGHTDSIISVAFSPNGRFALTGSWDQTCRFWDLTKSPVFSQKLTGHTSQVTSVAFILDGRFVLTRASHDIAARLWRIEQIDSTLPVEDSLLILKLHENDTSLNEDPEALNRLQLIVKESQQHPQITKLVADYLYKIKLPEEECWICTEKYDPEARTCMQLPCCKKQICKSCLDKLGNMTYLSQFEGYQFENSVQKKCPFCNKPANQMGTIKKFDTEKNQDNHGAKNV